MPRYTKTIGRTAESLASDQISVLSFGVAGDGSTPDSDLLTAAIQEVSQVGGGTLYFPGGRNYIIDKPIDLLSNVYLTGQGQNALLVRAANMPVGKGMINIVGKNCGMFSIGIEGNVMTSVPIPYAAQNVGVNSAVGAGTTLTFNTAVPMPPEMKTGSYWIITGCSGANYTDGGYIITVVDPTHFSIQIKAASGSYPCQPAVASRQGILDPMQADLTVNTSIWIKPGAEDITLNDVSIQHTGGYAVLIDSTTAIVRNVKIIASKFRNNRPHVFGTVAVPSGSWTGGIHYQGDFKAGKLFPMQGLLVTGCDFRRGTGNQIWGHSYTFATMHTNVRVTDNNFLDIGRDAVELAVTLGGVVSGNTGRRIGYLCSDDTTASVPNFPSDGQYSVFIDTSGTSNVNYINNTGVSVCGGGIDLDGFSQGIVSGNTIRVPKPGEFEYTEDNIAGWPRNVCYGAQLANNYFYRGGQNVAITSNNFINCGAGGVLLFSAQGCHVEGNLIDHPAAAFRPPVTIGNFTPADKTIPTTYSFDNTIVGNAIRWAPDGSHGNGAIQELENWIGGTGNEIPWLANQKNWAADNRLYSSNAAAFEFTKAPSSSSVTGTVISTQGAAPAANTHIKVSREQASGLNFTSMYGGNGDLLLRLLDYGQLNIAKNGIKGSITTGNRISQIVVDDTVATSHLLADGFLSVFGKTAVGNTYLDTDADYLGANYGLIRFNQVAHTFEQSVNVDAGSHRVWTALGSGGAGTVPGGVDQQVVFIKGTVLGTSINLTFDYTNSQMVVANVNTSSGIIAPLFNSSKLFATQTMAFSCGSDSGYIYGIRSDGVGVFSDMAINKLFYRMPTQAAGLPITGQV